MKLQRQLTILFLAMILIASTSCLRRERPLIQSRHEALRETSTPEIQDDLALAGLAEAIEAQLPILRRSSQSGKLQFGSELVERSTYFDRLADLALKLREPVPVESKLKYLQERFRYFEVYGNKNWGDVFITGYFEPVMTGSRRPSHRFSRALYRKPEDLLKLELARFGEKFEKERSRKARIEGDIVLPYYSRAEIDSQGALVGRGLELCWVDPVDAFFLHIQGSGTVELDDGSTIKLTYADKNGQPYEPIGRFLKEKVAPQSPTYEVIVEYLNRVTPEERQQIMNLNPSYVFFTESERNALTSLNVPATGGRTIATDKDFFPAGALAFMKFDRPTHNGTGKPVSRFVIDQDIGGAIKGPGRVDLFVGRGLDAGIEAGRMQQKGKLWYLVPKE